MVSRGGYYRLNDCSIDFNSSGNYVLGGFINTWTLLPTASNTLLKRARSGLLLIGWTAIVVSGPSSDI